MKLSSETVRVVQGFLCNDTSTDDFYAWAVSAEEDNSLPQAERDAIAGLRLLLLEFGEGLRPIDEVRAEATSLLASSDRVAASS